MTGPNYGGRFRDYLDRPSADPSQSWSSRVMKSLVSAESEAAMTAIKERPILMSSPMVRAIQAGLKTQTRRIVRGAEGFTTATEILESDGDPVAFWRFSRSGGFDGRFAEIPCPYGRVGDRLWVRETWRYGDLGHGACVEYRAGGPALGILRDDLNPPYRGPETKWRPSIHMPRWASRILLEIIDVRVERLSDISEADAIAEGLGVETCESVFRKAAGRAWWKFARLLVGENGFPIDTGENGYVCVDCAEKAAARHAAEIDGWNDYFETDSTPYCDECGALLCHSLTEYGVRSELGFTEDKELFWPHLPASDDFAFVLAELASGMGDLRDEHHGRLAQIAFATLWEQINGKGSWELNPWVWTITFREINT